MQYRIFKPPDDERSAYPVYLELLKKIEKKRSAKASLCQSPLASREPSKVVFPSTEITLLVATSKPGAAELAP